MSARGRSSAVDRLVISSHQQAPHAGRLHELTIHMLVDPLSEPCSGLQRIQDCDTHIWRPDVGLVVLLPGLQHTRNLVRSPYAAAALARVGCLRWCYRILGTEGFGQHAPIASTPGSGSRCGALPAGMGGARYVPTDQHWLQPQVLQALRQA